MKRFDRSFFWLQSIFAIILLGTGFLVSSKHVRVEELVPSGLTAASNIITYSVKQPSVQKADPIVLPKGTQPTDPVHITLPTIRAEGDIIKVGVDQKGAIAVPDNIHRAGWFVNSVRPGEKGLSIINGHIDPRSDEAIFQRLAEVKVGETFEIRLGNGTVQTYVVRNIQTLSLEESPAVLFSQLPRVSYQLNLITCAGTYDQERGLFTHRVVVAAELVSI